VAQKALALRAPNFPIAEGARPPHRATKRFCCLGFSTWNTLIASSIANLVQTSRSLSSLTMDLTFAPVQFTRMFSVVIYSKSTPLGGVCRRRIAVFDLGNVIRCNGGTLTLKPPPNLLSC
jgi:hypothetical protein